MIVTEKKTDATHGETVVGMSRPEANDRAMPMAYGDCVLLSSVLSSGSLAYLCEEGCVVMDPDVETRTSSRELVFQVCTARDARALKDMHEFLKKRGMPAGTKPTRQLSPSDEVLWQRLVSHREAEERNNEVHSQHMAGRTVSFGDGIQLQQVKSKMFLAIDIGVAPKIDALNKRVLQTSDPIAPITFKVMPRYKYLVEGNTVCYGDHLTFLSSDFQGEYLHASKGFLKTDIGIVHEVNLSSSCETAWNVECFFQQSQMNVEHVKAGDVVRLYHPFHDAYVAINNTDDTVCLQHGEGTLSSTMWVIGEDNILSGGSVRSGMSYSFMQLVTRAYLCSTAETLLPALQLHSDNPMLDDDPNNTNLFSAVEMNHRGGHNSMFTLEPMEPGMDGRSVKWGERFHMVHTASKRHVHCTKSHLLKKPLRGVKAGGLLGSARGNENPPDSASDTADPEVVPERVLVASPAFFREDSFDIVKVPEEQVQAVDTLSLILPPLYAFLASLEKALLRDDPDFPQDSLLEVIEALNDLQEYAFTAKRSTFVVDSHASIDDRQPITYCQNFLRDLQVPELIMNSLAISLNIMRKQVATAEKRAGEEWRDVQLVELVRSSIMDSTRNRTVKLVLKLYYQVLATIVHKHPHNAMHLSTYLDEIQDQLVIKLGAGDVLLEMLHGNDGLLRSLSEDTSKERHVRFHLDSLVKYGKDPMHLRFLSSLCASGEVGIERHQDIVLPAIISHTDDILLQVRLYHQAVQLRDAAPIKESQALLPLPDTWQDLGLIATGSTRPGEKGAVCHLMLEYWVESLQLLATLCKPGFSGRRDFVVKKIRNILSLDIGIICLQDDGLPDHLRCNISQLIRVAFVENDEFMKVTHMSGVAIWRDLASSESFPSARWEPLGGKDVDPEQSARYRADLKNTIRNYFSQNQCQHYPGGPYANELKLAMMQISRQLTLFGHYDQSELEGLVEDTRSVLDFSTMRFRSSDDIPASAAVVSSGAGAGVVDGDGLELEGRGELMLSEQTVTSALAALRPLCNSFPPMEVARLRHNFEVKVYEAGSIIVESGEPAGDFFILQSGVALMIANNDSVEVVVDTVSPGGSFGLETLTQDKAVWPWRIRCLNRVIALHLTRTGFQNASDHITQGGRMPLTDGLKVILDTKRVACLLLNDIYNLRLGVRCAKLLQEYRFDLNISRRQYYAEQTNNNRLHLFPVEGDNAERDVVGDFGWPLLHYLPKPIRRNIKPFQANFFGLIRVDYAVAIYAVLQYLMSCAILALLVYSSELPNEPPVPHPGPSEPSSVMINIAMTGVWSIFNIGLGWSAFTHSASIARACVWAQAIYCCYFSANTFAGFIIAIIDVASNSTGSENVVVAQVLWLIFLAPAGLYVWLAAASLLVHLNNPAYFVVYQRSREQESEDEEESAIPRREFIKMLEYFDLDEGGAFSRSLADLIISTHIPLVVDAFSLLVRTHRSERELHSALVDTLLLVDDEASQLDKEADSLGYQLITCTNAMQAYVVDRVEVEVAGLPRIEAQQRLEPLLKLVRQAEPLLNELLASIADGNSSAKIMRRLYKQKGLHRIVLRLLRSVPVDYHETTAPLCYTALAGMCDCDHDVQADLADNIDVLYNHFESLPKQVSMLLSAIYVDNVDLCYRVEDRLIERIVSMLRTEMHACYLVFLRVITFPAGQIVRRNQNIVSKCLEREAIDLYINVNDASMKDLGGAKRKEVSACYVTSLELLVACMAEGNHENKARCRGGSPNMTMTLKDITVALAERDLPGEHSKGRIKIALLRFMDEAYIRAEGGDNKKYILSPEVYDILDQYPRMIEGLTICPEGSRALHLKGAERELIIEVFPAVIVSYFSKVHPHQVYQAGAGRLSVVVRIVEAMAGFVLTGRKDLKKKEELSMVQVLQDLWDFLDHKDPRLCDASRKDKSGMGLEKMMLDVLGYDEEEATYTRQQELRLEVAAEANELLHIALDVQDGVVPFADEFLSVMLASGASESSRLMNAFRDTDENDRNEFSNQHMKSLVELLSSNEVSKDLRKTGLSILIQVMNAISYPSRDEIVEAGDQIKWLTEGVPRMVINLIADSDHVSTDDDDIVSESLGVGIILLEKGKRHAQDEFYSLFKGSEKSQLFHTFRERLVRAERGIPAFYAAFHRVGQEMGEECSAHGHVLTVAGVESIITQDRACMGFVGSHANEILRFLQLLCEGHNKDMQEYVRFQGRTSTDLVTCTADFLAVMSRYSCPATIELTNQCVDTLIEFVQNPCYSNQKGLVDTQLPHAVNHLLQMTSELPIEYDDHSDYAETVSVLKTKSVTLLLSLLERVDDPFVPERILKALEIDRLIDMMNVLRDEYLGEDAGEDDGEAEGEIEDEELSDNGAFKVACSFFMLFMMLKYYDTSQEVARKCNRTYIKDINRLKGNCGFVEISRGGRLERVFFQIPSVCRYLTRHAKDNILAKVNRDNHQDQMGDFVERGQIRYEEMLHFQELHTSMLYSAFSRWSDKLDVIFFLNALAINIIILFAYKYYDKEYKTLLDMANIIIDKTSSQILLVLTCLQLVMSVMRVMIYYLEYGVLRCKRMLRTRDTPVLPSEYGGPRYYYHFWVILMTDGYLLLLLLYMSTAIIAILLESQNNLVYFLMGVHLTDMFNLFPALQNVVRAVSSRANTLFQTAILGFIMMFIYSAIGFVFFADKFEFEEAEIKDGYRQQYNVNSARCDTIWKCFIVTIDMGLRKGDIGGAMDDLQWRDLYPGTSLQTCESVPGLEYLGCMGVGGSDVSPFIFLRILYTSSFFVLIDTILVNIIFGVIIDTFSDLREQTEEMEEEMEQRCFICGIEGYRFEINSSDGNGFENHVKDDHNMWTYLYFIVHLMRKDMDEHTGFESYVFEQVNEIDESGNIVKKSTPDVTWFPCNEAMVLKDSGKSKAELMLSQRIQGLSHGISSFSSQVLTQLQTITSVLERRKTELILAESESSTERSQSSSEHEDENDLLSAGLLSGRRAADAVEASAGGVLNAAQGLFGGMTQGLFDGNIITGGGEATRGPDEVLANQLNLLAEEGFDNTVLNATLIQQYAGDLDAVIAHLTEGDVGQGAEYGELAPFSTPSQSNIPQGSLGVPGPTTGGAAADMGDEWI